MFLTVVSATVLAHGCEHEVTCMLHPESLLRCADAPEMAELGLIEQHLVPAFPKRRS